MITFNRITSRGIERLFVASFLIIALIAFGWYNTAKPRILVLHSYDKNYAWVRDINIGLERGFKNAYLYHVNHYYMDTKRHPDLEFARSAGIAARNVIRQLRPDVLIAVDDDAQRLVARHFIDDPHMKIVFAGINNRAEEYGYERAKNVTGILERLPLKPIQEALLSVVRFQRLTHPIRIAFISDDSTTVNGDANQVQGFDWSPLVLKAVVQVSTFAEWQRQLETINNLVDVILVTNYRGLRISPFDHRLVHPKDVVSWTELHSPVPVLSGNVFFIEDGGMLAIGTSPYEQGEVAARDALAIALERKQPHDLPVTTSRQFVVSMSASRMNLRQFALPLIYEAAARTGNTLKP
jgi:hypothetical protein